MYSCCVVSFYSPCTHSVKNCKLDFPFRESHKLTLMFPHWVTLHECNLAIQRGREENIYQRCVARHQKLNFNRTRESLQSYRLLGHTEMSTQWMHIGFFWLHKRFRDWDVLGAEIIFLAWWLCGVHCHLTAGRFWPRAWVLFLPVKIHHIPPKWIKNWFYHDIFFSFLNNNFSQFDHRACLFIECFSCWLWSVVGFCLFSTSWWLFDKLNIWMTCNEMVIQSGYEALNFNPFFNWQVQHQPMSYIIQDWEPTEDAGIILCLYLGMAVQLNANASIQTCSQWQC